MGHPRQWESVCGSIGGPQELPWKNYSQGNLQDLGARLAAITLEVTLMHEQGEGGAFKGEGTPLGPRWAPARF